MNVLSLFDGMSCGRQALERAEIKVDNYFASEIDKYAITVTMANYPDTIQLGSVIDIDTSKLPQIDLLICGSPCQSFSFAGKRKGMSTKDNIEILTLSHYLKLKDEGYEFEGQSYLFWEYIRIMQEVKPKYFLLENVMMGEKWERVISKTLGVNPVEINSSLVSAQNRRRLYWTNIGMESVGLFGFMESKIKQPKDKRILLKDILQDNPNAKYYLSDTMINYLKTRKDNFNHGKINYKTENDKASCINKSSGSTDISDNIIVEKYKPIEVDEKYYLSDKMTEKMVITNESQNIIGHSGTGGQKGIIHNIEGQSSSLCATDYKQPKQIIVAMRGRTEKKGDDWHNSTHVQKLEKRSDGKTNSITGVAKDNLLMLNENQFKKFNHNLDIEKANCLTLAQGRAGSSEEYMDAVSKIAKIQGVIRRLTPIECERLQTVADNYTNHVSDSQRYKMLGNRWTVSVVSHIFSYLNK